MLLYFLIPSLLTFGSVELFFHWLRTWLHAENFWQLCLIRTKTGDRWEWLLQHLCRCCKQSVHVSARLCVLCFSLSYNIAERAKMLFELLWGQLRNRTRKETRVWKKPTPPSKMSTRLLTLLPMINSKGKCPTDVKDLTKTWLKSGRIFHSLWVGHRFIGG